MAVKDTEIRHLYEIVLAIGTSVDLGDMLDAALDTMLKKLDCSAAGVFMLEKEGSGVRFKQVFAIPGSAEADSAYAGAVQKIPPHMEEPGAVEFLKGLPLVGGGGGGGFFHIFELADFGVLILIKKLSPLDGPLISSLGPVLVKLAEACNSCMRNEEIAAAHAQVVEINSKLEERSADLEISRDMLLQMMLEVKQTEEELCKLGRAVEQSPSMVVITDVEGKIEYVNPRYTLATGLEAEDVIGRNLAEIDGLSPEEFGGLREQVCSGREFQGEFQRMRNGLPCWEYATISPIKDSSGETTHLIKAAEDITERKRLEAELMRSDKLESIGILAGGIAHDFNNILTSLLNNISIAKMTVRAGDAVYKRLRAAEKATLRAQNLTRHLLTFSRGGDPVKQTIFLKGLLRDSADFALRGSDIKCEYSLQRGLWPVDADEGQISQVISNLVINAEQAMGGRAEGGVIKVSAENVSGGPEEALLLKEGRYIKFSVQDTGGGIEEDHLHKIFDPYFTTKPDGTGLGLATCWAIINKHGGHIAVESKPGEGTAFHVYLPASEMGITGRVVRREKFLNGRGKILLMDDDPDIGESTTAALAHFGYSVDFAEDGEKTIEKYCREKDSGAPFDAVIMDLTIPGGMGGRETIKRLLQIDPGIRAIVSSGYSNDPAMSDFRKLGFSGLLAKPYRMDELMRLLRDVIKPPAEAQKENQAAS